MYTINVEKLECGGIVLLVATVGFITVSTHGDHRMVVNRGQENGGIKASNIGLQYRPYPCKVKAILDGTLTTEYDGLSD